MFKEPSRLCGLQLYPAPIPTSLGLAAPALLSPTSHAGLCSAAGMCPAPPTTGPLHQLPSMATGLGNSPSCFRGQFTLHLLQEVFPNVPSLPHLRGFHPHGLSQSSVTHFTFSNCPLLTVRSTSPVSLRPWAGRSARGWNGRLGDQQPAASIVPHPRASFAPDVPSLRTGPLFGAFCPVLLTPGFQEHP